MRQDLGKTGRLILRSGNMHFLRNDIFTNEKPKCVFVFVLICGEGGKSYLSKKRVSSNEFFLNTTADNFTYRKLSNGEDFLEARKSRITKTLPEATKKPFLREFLKDYLEIQKIFVLKIDFPAKKF